MATLCFYSRSAKGPDPEFTAIPMQNKSPPSQFWLHHSSSLKVRQHAVPGPWCSGAQLVVLALPNSRGA